MAVNPTKKRQGASLLQIQRRDRLGSWGQQHQLVAVETLLRLLERPIGSLMTWMVIAIALTLPGALWMALDNLSQLTGRFQQSGSISVYLSPGTSDARASELMSRIQVMDYVEKTRYISPEQALIEFRNASGLSEALDLLKENPLPGVILVEPNLQAPVDIVQQLQKSLQKEASVDSADLDTAWLDRMQALLDLSRRVVWVMGCLLALAIVLVVGNTIRLSIAARVDEIRVIKLVGGTNAWVRRPFLYMGLWFGLVGGLMSWILLVLSWIILRSPVNDLSSLYGSAYTLQPLSAGAALVLLIGAMLLGWLGSWWSVVRHLNDIEPQ
ncbi:MAG: permease-like cell division protein FtsX [Oleibacter sp.]|nr:permease-like cell division protein FtsX [Thalassolituus sp.]